MLPRLHDGLNVDATSPAFSDKGRTLFPRPKVSRQDVGPKPCPRATRKKFNYRKAASNPNLVALHLFSGPNFCRPAVVVKHQRSSEQASGESMVTHQYKKE